MWAADRALLSRSAPSPRARARAHIRVCHGVVETALGAREVPALVAAELGQQPRAQVYSRLGLRRRRGEQVAHRHTAASCAAVGLAPARGGR